MTKWKRLKKLREQKRFEAEALRPKAEKEEAKPTPVPSTVIYESREKEPYMFECADIRSTRNTITGLCEWEVEKSDTERFEKHHFFLNGRVRRKA